MWNLPRPGIPELASGLLTTGWPGKSAFFLSCPQQNSMVCCSQNTCLLKSSSWVLVRVASRHSSPRIVSFSAECPQDPGNIRMLAILTGYEPLTTRCVCSSYVFSIVYSWLHYSFKPWSQPITVALQHEEPPSEFHTVQTYGELMLSTSVGWRYILPSFYKLIFSHWI